MNETMNLQDAILKEVRRDRVPVTLFLMNGFQLRGVITGYDSFVVVLVTDLPIRIFMRILENPALSRNPVKIMNGSM